MDVASRRLLVVRHAKSAWPAGVPDRLRPLGPRGLRDAPRWASGSASSSAPWTSPWSARPQRTRQTWALIDEELGHPGPW